MTRKEYDFHYFSLDFLYPKFRSLSLIDAFSFVIGASCWESRQLEGEIARGYWLPCNGPPEMTLTGECFSLETGPENDKLTPESDIWLSMMCAMGDHEARMAQFVFGDKHRDENGEACDDI